MAYVGVPKTCINDTAGCRGNGRLCGSLVGPAEHETEECFADDSHGKSMGFIILGFGLRSLFSFSYLGWVPSGFDRGAKLNLRHVARLVP